MDKFEIRRQLLQGLVDSLGRGAIAAIAKKIEKEPSYVSRMLYTEEKAGRKRIGEDTIELLAKAYPEVFNSQRPADVAQPVTSIDQSASIASTTEQTPVSSELGERIELKAMREIPVVGEVRGGDDGFLEEFQYPVGHGEGFVDYPTTDPNAYALRVRGDSMHPRYRAGEFVVVEPNIEPQVGDDVVVECLSGKKMLKQLNWHKEGEIQLLSINNGYAPLTIPDHEVLAIHLVAGRARRNAMHF